MEPKHPQNERADRDRARGVTPGSRSGGLAGGSVATILTVLGIGLYGVLRVVHVEFYSHFGLKPEDVGLGYTETLSQSVVGLVVLAVLIFVLALMIEVTFQFSRAIPKQIRAETRTTEGRTMLISTVIFLAAVFAGWVYVPDVMAGLLLALVILSGVSAAWRHGGARRSEPKGVARQEAEQTGNKVISSESAQANVSSPYRKSLEFFIGRSARRLKIAAVITVALSVPLLFVIASADAKRVAHGIVVREVLMGIFPVGAWGAETARITPVSEEAAKALGGASAECVMYLGQADGLLVAVLPHPQRARALKFPAGQAVVTLTPDRRSCQAMRDD